VRVREWNGEEMRGGSGKEFVEMFSVALKGFLRREEKVIRSVNG
jgi:hypothetical protein